MWQHCVDRPRLLQSVGNCKEQEELAGVAGWSDHTRVDRWIHMSSLQVKCVDREASLTEEIAQQSDHPLVETGNRL